MNSVRLTGLLLAVVATLAGCRPAAPLAARTAESEKPLLFAVIGDYGQAGPGEAAVARLVLGWRPAFIATTGDNNYPAGAAETIDANIGQYYHAFIGHYRGRYGAGAPDSAAFFPSLGNHDVVTAAGQPYFDYFTLPGNERYYQVRRGPVELFVLNANPSEPDGTSPESTQGQWLRAALAASGAPWKLVVLHHPPFSSARNGSSPWMQWPYPDWGAHAVLAGHDHTYERFEINGFPYLVNGLGGRYRYPFRREAPVAGSRVRYQARYGALRGRATARHLALTFVNVGGRAVDSLVLVK